MIMILINTADRRFTQWDLDLSLALPLSLTSELTVHGIAEGTVSWHMLVVVVLVHCSRTVAKLSLGIRFGGRFPVIAAAASASSSDAATNHIARTGARCDVDHILLVCARRRCQRSGQLGVLCQRMVAESTVAVAVAAWRSVRVAVRLEE